MRDGFMPPVVGAQVKHLKRPGVQHTAQQKEQHPVAGDKGIHAAAMAELAAIAGPPNQPATPDERRAIDSRILKLAGPAVLESLLATALYIVDTMMVAPLGSAVIAASGVSSVILWRSFMTAGCIERGTTAMVARHIGAGNHAMAGRVAAQSVILAIIIGALLAGFGVALSTQFLVWMGSSPEVVRPGADYLAVIFLASIPRLITIVLGAALRGAGDTRAPVRVMVWMNLVNLLLNYLLIYGHWGFPRLGLLGSGIATALSMTVGMVIYLHLAFSGRHGIRIRLSDFRPHRTTLRTMTRLSVPGLADELIVTFGFLIFFSYIARLGTTALAAHTISTRIESFSFMVGMGFAIAAATLVGQALGMKSERLAHLAFRRSTILCMWTMAVIALLLILFGRQMLAIFRPEQVVHDLAFTLLIIAAVEQPLLGIAATLGSGIRGAGDTVNPMIISFIGNVVIRIVAVHYLTFTLGLGIYGVYLGTVVDWIVRSILLYLAYRRGRWLRIRI